MGQDERVSKRWTRGKGHREGGELTQQMMALAKAYRLEKKPYPLVRWSAIRWSSPEGLQCAMGDDVPDDTWQVSADGSAVKGVISNLVINARQEMASGGMLTATVRNEMICR